MAGMDAFHPSEPLYNPHLKAYGEGVNEYWTELDFPESGKGGNFDKALYNTFLQNKHQTLAMEAIHHLIRSGEDLAVRRRR